MKQEHRPLKITAMIWIPKLPQLSVESVKHFITKIEDLLNTYQSHSIALPEIMYVPGFRNLARKVACINRILEDFNRKKGFQRYPLFKVGSAKNNWMNGFMLKNKKKLVSFIRKFHLNNFMSPIKLNFSVTVKNTDTVVEKDWESKKEKDWMKEGIELGLFKKYKALKNKVLKRSISSSKRKIEKISRALKEIKKQRKQTRESPSSSSANSDKSAQDTSDSSSDEERD